jgi:hypothetical protein
MSEQVIQTTVKIKTIQEAIAMANEVERHEAALKQMKDALKTFVEESGLPIDTGEKIWDFSLSESWTFAPDNLKALASEILLMGYNPWEYLDLGSRAIDKLNLTKDMLNQYGTSKTTKRFASKKSESKTTKTKKSA